MSATSCRLFRFSLPGALPPPLSAAIANVAPARCAQCYQREALGVRAAAEQVSRSKGAPGAPHGVFVARQAPMRFHACKTGPQSALAAVFTPPPFVFARACVWRRQTTWPRLLMRWRNAWRPRALYHARALRYAAKLAAYPRPAARCPQRLARTWPDMGSLHREVAAATANAELPQIRLPPRI